MSGQHTPAANWREAGEPDPHGERYNCERNDLALSKFTDDELANAVFLHDHRSLNLSAIMAGEPSSIGLLTAAKDRIRWLSRQTVKAEQQRDELLAALKGLLAITSDSQGVAGYHLNGAIAQWGEFEEIDIAANAIAKAES